MIKIWQSIQFVEGQTVEEFLKQFARLEKSSTIKWSSLGGIFTNAKENPSPHDGKVHVNLPITQTQETQ